MKDKLLRFMRENGFLLFLFVCVCIVAAGTIFILTKEVRNPKDDNLAIHEETDSVESENKSTDKVSEETGEKDEDPNNQEENKDIGSADEAELKDKDNASTNEDNLKEVFAGEKDKDDEEIEFIEDAMKKEDKVAFKFSLPLDGEIITDFTTDSLIYSETLDEWRGHQGIDIKGKQGTKVKCACDGLVKEVYEDPLWGNVIVIDHGNGLLTKYANLGTKDMVKVGLEVKLGDEIATIGKTASIEMLMDSHLHFEAIKDGKLIDPRSIK